METLRPSSSMSGTNLATGAKEQPHERGQGQAQGQELRQPFVAVGSGQAGRIDPSVEICNPEPRADQEQQQMEYRGSSYSVGDGSSSGNILDGVDEWLDMGSFFYSSLAVPPENLDGSVEMSDKAMEDSLSGHADSPTGFDDIALLTSPGSFPTPDNLTQPSVTSHDVAWPLASTIPSPRNQPPASLTPDPHTKGPVPAAPAAFSLTLTGQWDAKDGCPCLHLMACLLEELGAESASGNPAKMDLLLSYLRGALARCSTVLDCERCTSLSDYNMLLAMVGQYMSTICERIVMCYLELQCVQEQRQSQQQLSISSLLAGVGGVGGDQETENGGTRSGSGLLNADDIWFSTYRIDNSYERMQVLQCLASIQLTEFARLLEKLQARGGRYKGHLVLLTEAEKRIKAVQLMLRTNLNRPSAERI
ncbi:MAG: hypothetical protein Q9176_004733 [Flavoplaca citrina]